MDIKFGVVIIRQTKKSEQLTGDDILRKKGIEREGKKHKEREEWEDVFIVKIVGSCTCLSWTSSAVRILYTCKLFSRLATMRRDSEASTRRSRSSEEKPETDCR